MSDDAGVNDAHSDYSARGMAQEAIAALRSHDALDTLRFGNIEKQFQDIKGLIVGTNSKIDNMSKAYDNRFWSLAVSIIFGLVTCIAAFVWRLLFK